MLSGMLRVHLVDYLHGNFRYCFTGHDHLDKINGSKVTGGNMMSHHSNSPLFSFTHFLPILVGAVLDKGNEVVVECRETFHQLFCSLAHNLPPGQGWFAFRILVVIVIRVKLIVFVESGGKTDLDENSNAAFLPPLEPVVQGRW